MLYTFITERWPDGPNDNQRGRGKLGISARMLRYYEKEGMVESLHRENYAYRVYDEHMVRRIRQIILLRKLQIPLKKIRVIMDGNRQEAIRAVKEQMADAERDIASMQTIKAALSRLWELLQREDLSAEHGWESAIENLAGMLPSEKHQLKGSAGSPISASEKEKHIRIILLPPCTVASFQYFGENPEERVGVFHESIGNGLHARGDHRCHGGGSGGGGHAVDAGADL